MMMMLDGASSHVSKDLVIPENIRLLRLPPYAPELNPQEQVWDEIREKEFPNRVFNDLPSVARQLEVGLPCPGSPPTPKVCIVSVLGLGLHSPVST